MSEEKLSDFVPSRDWVVDHGGALFQTFSSFEFFVRKHRKRLVDSGQLILGGGRARNLIGPGMASVVLEIIREESAERVAEEAA